MKKRILSWLCAAAAVAAIAAPTVSAEAVPNHSGRSVIIQTASMSVQEQQAAALINRYRRQAGVSPAAISTEISRQARVKSRDMKTNRYFSHTSPTYGSPFSLMRVLGVTYESAAENIAMGYYNAEDVVEAWMNSPSHRNAMLSDRYTTMGIGYADGYWTLWLIR